jgi:hypothetical protein
MCVDPMGAVAHTAETEETIIYVELGEPLCYYPHFDLTSRSRRDLQGARWHPPILAAPL